MKPFLGYRPVRITTALIAAALSILFAETPATFAQPSPATSAGPALTVDASGGYAISPDIYGMNFAYDSPRDAQGLVVPVNRWGGNAVTRYNYLTNISNHASDWYFENILEGSDTGLPDNSAANAFIETGNAAGTKTLLTVPTIGYVSNGDASACGFSRSKYGNQQANDWQWRPDCYNGVKTNGTDVTGNDPLDTSIVETPTFVGNWVTYLNTRYGSAAPKYYALDNEPDLWYETHRDVHPAGAGYQELFDRGSQYAAAIKGADSSAKVFGPVSWGWWGYFYSAQDVATHPNWWDNSDANNPDRAAHGHQDFIPWYLSQMKNYSDTHSGQRLLDYLDIHFYTQVPGVSLDSGASRDVRLRSTRSLWDATYHESDDGSWIQAEPSSPDPAPVNLIPRMHAWVDTYYPGTKLAITEYNWGAPESIDGALAQADVLGIFGREKLDLATLWGPPSPGQPLEYAFKMYLNYDGAGGHFGDTSISSTSADQGQLAVYGSKDSGDGTLKLMVVNKTSKALASPVSLSNFTSKGFLRSYTYSQSKLNGIVQSWQPISGTSFTFTFPAASITLLVIPPDSSSETVPTSALAAPTLSAPKDGGSLTTTSVKLSWKKEKGATSYFVIVKDKDGNQVFSANPTASSVTAALGYGHYTWQVQAVAPDGITLPSVTRTFDLSLLTAPKNGVTMKASKVVFKWKAIKGATYSLQMTKDGTPQPSIDNLTKPTYKPPTALAPGTYTWTVTVTGGATMPEWTVIVTN